MKRRKLGTAQMIVLGFLAVILVGTFCLSMPFASASGQGIGVVNALFTATSSVCVTGLVVADTGSAFTLFGQVVIILLIQIGGLGFMTLASMLLMAVNKRVRLRDRMVLQETLNANVGGGTGTMVRRVLGLTFAIEGMGALLLSIRFIPAFGFWRGLGTSLFLSVSAFCNAGFDPLGNGFASLTAYMTDPIVNITIMSLIIAGGLGFVVYFDIAKNKRYKKLMLHSRVVLVMTGLLLVGGTLLLAMAEWNNPATIGNLSDGEKVMAAAFQSVTSRTAGFDSIGQANMTGAGKIWTMLLMFIGASPGSTGGGIKTTTLAVIFFCIVSTLKNREDTVIGKRRIAESLVKRALVLMAVSAATVLAATVLISMLEGGRLSIDSILFDVISGVSTTGLSYGITPELHVGSKLLLAFLMFAGRVGPLTLMVALPSDPTDTKIKYPREEIMIG